MSEPMTNERLELKQSEPISDADKLAEAEAWIHCIPVEIRWMFEEALSVGNRLRAEVERYRAALERLAEECCDGDPYCPEQSLDEDHGSGHFPRCSAHIAYDALNPEATS